MVRIIDEEKGFSLLETIVAVSILFIFIIAFSVLFSDSYTSIFVSGYKSEAQYILQEAAENELSNVSKTMPEVVKQSQNVSGFEISFDAAENIILDGDRLLIETTFSDGKGNQRNINITAFIPTGGE